MGHPLSELPAQARAPESPEHRLPAFPWLACHATLFPCLFGIGSGQELLYNNPLCPSTPRLPGRQRSLAWPFQWRAFCAASLGPPGLPLDSVYFSGSVLPSQKEWSQVTVLPRLAFVHRLVGKQMNRKSAPNHRCGGCWAGRSGGR